MKKGFTLVELLAVIIILGVIALITFPVIDNSIKKSKEESLQRTIDAIEQASYEYSVDNDIGYPSIDAPSSLSLDDLKQLIKFKIDKLVKKYRKKIKIKVDNNIILEILNLSN